MARLKPEHLTPVNQERFLREARILANLEHQNIVPLYEINYRDKEELFFTMKLLSGETLYTIIKKLRDEDHYYTKNYSLKKLLNILISVCDAIEYAHSKGILHLDLKPENIQISEFGEVSVIDWGLAKYLKYEKDNESKTDDFASFTPITDTNINEIREPDLPSFMPISDNPTSVGIISGTPGYMSPEQADKNFKSVNIQSDIYSLGATLYTILYKGAPFQELEIKEIIKKTHEGACPDFPDRYKDEAIPSALRAIAIKAMEPDKDKRYQSVKDLKDDIIRYLNDFATQAENINLLKITHLFIKRHYKKIIVILLISTAIAIPVYLSRLETEKQRLLAESQATKLRATASDVITGTMEKHKQLYETYGYDALLANYERLINLGYNYPEFWYEKAKLYAGRLNFTEAIYCMNQVTKFETTIDQSEEYKKILFNLVNVEKKAKSGPLNNEDIMSFSLNMPVSSQAQIMWRLNTDPNRSIEEKFKLLFKNICIYNPNIDPEKIQFQHSIENNYIKINLSNNPDLKYALPLLGFPMDSLDLSYTNAQIGELYHHFKTRLTEFNMSGTNISFLDHFLREGNIEKLVIRNSYYNAGSLHRAKKLKYLDLEGTNVFTNSFTSSNTLEYLNIAHTDIKIFGFLSGYKNLKTLVIDDTKVLPEKIIKALKKQGTEIQIKQ
jgi:eukaryotic-like serine/threonine-protein kinase